MRAANPRLVYCSTSGFGQDGPWSRVAGHDLNYLAVGGFLDTTHARADGGPPVPGATVADSAGGGMQAVIAILAALVRRSTTGEGAYLDVAAADGVVALMSLAIDEYLATGVVPGPRHGLLTGQIRLLRPLRSRRRQVAVGRGDRAALLGESVPACSGASNGRRNRWTTTRRTRSAPTSAPRSRPSRATSGPRCSWKPTRVSRRCCRCRSSSTTPQFAARGAFVGSRPPEAGRFRQTAPVLAGQPAPDGPYQLRAAIDTDVDELLHAAGLTAAEITALRDEGVVA